MTIEAYYDDTPHYPDLPDFPHHKHIDQESNVVPATAPGLAFVVAEIEELIGVE